jgi:anaphase-promoting complex subunit 8
MFRHRWPASQTVLGQVILSLSNSLISPRDAIECFKRALIGADPHETKINLQLAKLYHDLEEYAEASAYHRRIVELSVADGISRYDHGTMVGTEACVIYFLDRPIQHFSKSCLYVAQYHMTTPGGDLHLARDFLERVANSNASDVQEASDMLKTLTAKLQAQEDAMFAATIHASAVGD